MSTRRSRRTQYTLPEEDFNFEEMYGPQRYLESAVRTNPDLRTGFDYSQLEEKFPVRSIEGRMQLEERRRAERPYLEEDLEYKKTLLAEREAELGLKKAARDLDLYESRINREDAMLEQVPLARQALGQLDPRDPDYLSKRMDVVNKYPVAFEYDAFIETVDKPMLFRHSKLREGRIETGKEVTEDAFQKAAGLLSDPTFQKQVQAGDQIALGRAAVARETYNKFMQQQGIGAAPQQETGMEMEMDTGMEVADPDVLQARQILSRRPELRDEINRRLISAGKPPIE